MSYPPNIPPVQKDIPSYGQSRVQFGSGRIPSKPQSPLVGWLLTLISMLVSIACYAVYFKWGWSIAVGFVICLLIHELGHVVAALYYRIPASAPIFIPGMGALIMTRKASQSAIDDAVMGIAGPLFGTLAAFGCWALYSITKNDLYLAIAMFGFFLNLFNMLPVFPLDGGRIAGAIHPWLWIVGIAGLGYMFYAGIINPIQNPIILLIIVMSAPQIIQGIRSGSVNHGYRVLTTKRQSQWMGVAYVTLGVILLASLIITNNQLNQLFARA